MNKLLKRLNANILTHQTEMMLYARIFDLPYVEDDLIEFMEFWTNKESETIHIVLVTNSIEYYNKPIDLNGRCNYSEMASILNW